MLAIISPAKTLDYKKPLPPVTPTAIRLPDETDKLATAAAKLGPKKLSALMHISDNLAQLNAERYKGFAELPERPALFAFAGDVYAGFEAYSLDESAIDFAQDHLRILSGLYGLLRPLDAIRPYRLEMGTRWAPRKSDLYAFWGSKIGDLLGEDLAAEGSGDILNLASKEYWHAVAKFPPKGARIITVDFRENGPKGLYFNSFGAKRARGMMSRWMCEHHVTDIDAMRGFDSDGYRFVADDSDATTWRFVRG